MIRRVVAGAIVSAAISAAGWRASALSERGALAATGVGTTVVAGSTWRGVVVLGTFFVSSSALSRSGHKKTLTAKGSRRDERQVLANGAVAALGALAGGRIDPLAGLGLAAGALAAATADTWATELGSRSSSVPRLIFSGRGVPPGISGGVTRQGTLGSLAGALVVGGVTGVLASTAAGWKYGLRLGTGVTIGGLAGSMADSALGELLQVRRWCPECNMPTESNMHICATPTVVTGGVPWVDNDIVNLACTVVGCLVVLPFLRH